MPGRVSFGRHLMSRHILADHSNAMPCICLHVSSLAMGSLNSLAKLEISVTTCC